MTKVEATELIEGIRVGKKKSLWPNAIDLSGGTVSPKLEAQ